MNAFPQTLRRIKLLTGLALIASAGLASAAITTYTSLATFNTALGASPSETYSFTGQGGTKSSPYAFTAGTFDFSVWNDTTSPGTDNLTVTGGSGSPFPEAVAATGDFFTPGLDLVVTFTASPNNVKAVGGNFWFSDLSEGSAGGSFIIRAFDGTTTTDIPVTTSAGGAGFAGFITDGASFTRLTFVNDSGDLFTFATLDNLKLGNPVPEAPTWIAAALLGSVAAVRVWRRRQSRAQ